MADFNIYELIATLDLDTSKFDRAVINSQKQTVTLTKNLSTLERSSKSASTSIGKDLGGALSVVSPRLSSFVSTIAGAAGPVSALAIGVAAIGGAGIAAAAGVIKLTTSVASSIDEIGDMAEKVNFSVRTLSGLAPAVEAAGGNLEGFVNALGIFDKNIESAAQGNERLSRLFKALKIDATDNEAAFRQVADVLSRLGGTSQQTALAMELFGRSGKDVLGAIKAAGGNVENFIRQMEELGVVIGDDAVKAADSFDKQLVLVRAQFDAVIRQLGLELMPMVQEAAQNASNWLKKNQGEIRKTISEVDDLIRTIGRLTNLIMSINPLVLTVKVVRMFGSMLPDQATITSTQQQRGVFTQDPVTGRRIYSGNAPYDVAGEYAIAGGAGTYSTGAGPKAGAADKSNALADQIRKLLERGGGGKGGGKSQKDELDSLRSSLVLLNAEYRKYRVEILGSVNASALAAEKEHLLATLMGALKVKTREQISAMRDVDDAINAAIGALPAKSRDAARAIADQSLAQFKLNMEMKNAGELNRKAEELTQGWRLEMDRSRNGADEYAIAIENLEKEYRKYGLTLDASTRRELEQLAVTRRELDLVLQITRARQLLRSTRDRVVTREMKERPDWIDLGGGSTVGGEPSTTGRPRVATTEEQVIRERLEIYRDNVRKVAYETTNLLDRALYDGFTGGGVKEGLASLARGMLDIVRNIFLRELEEGLTKILTNAGSSTAGGGGKGSIWSTLLNMGIGVFAGLFGGGASSGGIGSAAGDAVGGFASGGYVHPNTWYLRGERGPELAKSGPMGDTVLSNSRSMAALAGAGNVYLTVNARDAASFNSRETQTQIKRKMMKLQAAR